jgi:hypothetical protein
MWIFTRYGFYSIACADTPEGQIDPDTVMVRSRLKQHLANLKKRFARAKGLQSIATAQIQEGKYTDYMYRIIVPKSVWVRALTEMALEQTWRNFKNEATKYEKLKKQARDYVDALHRIWDVMHALQPV